MGFEHLIGRRLDDKFEIQAYLAKGGMGVVFRGIQHPLGREVAIKILTVDEDDSFRERFFNEAAICANISHPNVVRVFDYGVTDDGICFIVMELLKGEALATMLKREGRLSPRLALEVMRDVCSAVQDAHNHGVVHRDLKPGNLFVVERQQRGLFVKVLDFGLAKKIAGDGLTTKTGTFLGSPTYISPEQVKGEMVSPRSDIYNAGLILYRMLVGTPPFKNEHPSATLVAHCTQAPEPFAVAAPGLEVPPGLEWVVTTCLQKNPDRRFASMDELTKALEICQMVMRGSVPPQRLEITSDGRLVVPSGLILESQLDTGILQTSVVDLDAGGPSMSTRPATMLLVGAGSGVLVTALLAGIIGVTGALAWRAWREPTVEPATPVPVAAPASSFEVKVLSTPEGATVFKDNAALGRTPLEVEIPNGEEWTVILSASGHRNREVILRATQPLVRVPLLPY
ncbi:MAG: serine/threonine protein kinase [Myxococcales bacterium]|nr:serine/threonine protein kinase [Myxococcales bacterium]